MSSSKTIAKNTLFLYVRMFFNMGVSLYTSRIILRTLGVDDYGIYNLVGGVVVLFSFLNAAMSSSTQRFLNFEIAQGNLLKVNRLFCTSFNIHLLISFVVLLLGETIGLWFLNHKLNIPEDRLYAANWVYQMSLLTTIIDITRIPYNAVIIAYQRMSFYAYVGILETILKLVIVYLLLVFNGYDRLIVYGILLMIVNFMINIIYRWFCIKKYNAQSIYRFVYDKKLMLSMASFSGWNLLGQVANVGASQGIGMILNIFLGVTLNAAVGIANQVNAAIYSFVSNFQVAFNPQITQTYAKGEFERHNNLILTTSKMSFFLLAFLAFPILVNTDFVLQLWLGDNIPSYVREFTQIIIFISLIDALSGPFWIAAHAIGNIKKYQIILSLILLLNLPLVYLSLKLGLSPTYAFLWKFLLNILAFCYRFWYIKNRNHLDKKKSLSFLFVAVITLILIVGMTNYSCYSFTNNNYLNFAIKCVLVEFILFTIAVCIGLNKKEREQIVVFIKRKISKN
ncbi:MULTISPECIES: MATE family efflux transporter [unclassified Sphingobacterium]|uniref:MATE family efflux transporter n=1 Tax=unclassified Sphingobacterium TaxID=2609468 RepID=UPI0025FC2568|nr:MULTISPECIES: MATE family efflux transporter [unclassified Sphingobacterium]